MATDREIEGEPARPAPTAVSHLDSRDDSRGPKGLRMGDSRGVTRLLAGLAHGVRTPLNSMMLTLALLEDKHGDRLDAEDHADFATLRADIRSILELHENILRHACLAEGRIAPDESEFALDEALVTCAEVVRPQAAKKGLALVLDLRAPTVIRSDRSMLDRLVGNLLSNAVRCTERGRITLRSRLDGHVLAVEVEDTGIGIDPEDRDRIFEEYYRAAPGGDGNGLGLATARLMAELLGGALTVESEVGRGSTFTFSLPGPTPTAAPPANGERAQP